MATRSYGKYTASYRFVNAAVAGSNGASTAAQGKNTGFKNPFGKGTAAILGSLGLGKLGRATEQLAGENIGECHGATKWRGTGKALRCTCPANFSIKGPIWGTDIYTDDSFICKAALHAGQIGRSGGQVSIRMLPGQSSYAGTERNGVTTLSYGRHAGSFRFN